MLSQIPRTNSFTDSQVVLAVLSNAFHASVTFSLKESQRPRTNSFTDSQTSVDFVRTQSQASVTFSVKLSHRPRTNVLICSQISVAFVSSQSHAAVTFSVNESQRPNTVVFMDSQIPPKYSRMLSQASSAHSLKSSQICPRSKLRSVSMKSVRGLKESLIFFASSSPFLRASSMSSAILSACSMSPISPVSSVFSLSNAASPASAAAPASSMLSAMSPRDWLFFADIPNRPWRIPTNCATFSITHVSASAIAETALAIHSKTGDASVPIDVLSFLMLSCILELA